MFICVTGPMAAGKNFVSSIIEGQIVNGKTFASIDADIAGHKAVENSAQKIAETFGELAAAKGIQLTDSSGKIIRRNLGALIFGNSELVARQESIVYPEITSIIEKFMAENVDRNVIVNATVLYKIPLVKKMDLIVYVDCPALLRFFRARKRDGMKAGQILARFKSQRRLYSEYEKTGCRIVRICNWGSKKSLRKKIQFLLTNC